MLKTWTKVNEALSGHYTYTNGGEEVLLQVVERSAGNGLVDAKNLAKGLLGDTTVLELGEHHLAVLGQERARSVAVVGGLGLLAIDSAEQVADENRGFGCDSSGSLGGGKARGITGGPDVGELVVAEGVVVDGDVTGLIGDSAVLDESMRSHLGNDVHKVKLLGDLLLSVGASEDGLVAVDLNKVVLEETLDTSLLAHLLKGGAVLGNTEHDGEASGEADLDGRSGGVLGVVETSLLPVVEGKPHGLLRGTGALDDTSGLSEDGVTLLESLNVGEDLVTEVVAVDG
ncbi:hypothetical protein HG531_008899 [Fusarium graminearum]|nr:hypothetical protein HG531_008899 [Fusarium graminearum]